MVPSSQPSWFSPKVEQQALSGFLVGALGLLKDLQYHCGHGVLWAGIATARHLLRIAEAQVAAIMASDS